MRRIPSCENCPGVSNVKIEHKWADKDIGQTAVDIVIRAAVAPRNIILKANGSGCIRLQSLGNTSPADMGLSECRRGKYIHIELEGIPADRTAACQLCLPTTGLRTRTSRRAVFVIICGTAAGGRF